MRSSLIDWSVTVRFLTDLIRLESELILNLSRQVIVARGKEPKVNACHKTCWISSCKALVDDQ